MSKITIAKIQNGMIKYKSNPLSDEELESKILGASKKHSLYTKKIDSIANSNSEEHQSISEVGARYLSKNVVRNEPLHGCAFNGAVSTSLHLKDVVVLAHSPKSCAYISYQTTSSAGRRAFFERGALLPVSLAPNLECTQMRESDMVFGGMEALREKLSDIKKNSPKAIVIVSACPAGIIGDDISQTAAEITSEHCPVVAIKADGNMTGDYLQGMLMTYTDLAKGFIKKDVPLKHDTVNIVFEKFIAKNTNTNFEVIKNLLSSMCIHVNCRFLCETTYEALQNFCSAPLNLLAYKDYTGRILKDFFEKDFGCRFLTRDFPIGFNETVEWIHEIADFFNKQQFADDTIKQHTEIYNAKIHELKPFLRGKKLMIITYNHNLDWILKTAIDLDMDIVKLGILNFSQDAIFTSNLDVELNVEENYNKDNRESDFKKYQPDILLSNYEFILQDTKIIADTIPMCPDVGFFSGIEIATRWAAMFKMDLKGEWRQDEHLFKKYYTR